MTAKQVLLVSSLKTVGSYEIYEERAHSALGTLYLATDRRNGTKVALKVLRTYFAQEPGLLERCFQDLAKVRELQHPNILAPIDWGVDAENAWIASEYAPEGSLLTTWIEGGALEDVVHIVAGVAAAQQAALDHGTTHRDVRPSNVFWDPETGRVRLGDFGIASAVDSAHSLLRASLTTPLPAYQAPEYISNGVAYGSTEAFSLAVLAYWLLTGSVPFSAYSPAAMYAAVLRGDIVPPSAANPALSPEVDVLFQAALSSNARRRPPDPAAFAEALQVALGVQPGTGQPAPSAARPATARRVGSAPAPDAAQLSSADSVAPSVEAGSAAEETDADARYWSRPDLLRRLWRPTHYDTRKERLVQASVLAACLALAYMVFFRPPVIPAPTTDLTAAVQPEHWVLPRYDFSNAAYTPVSSRAIQGRLRWKFQTSEPFLASPTSDGATVYAATGERRVVALDLATGAVRWEWPSTGPIDATPTVAGDFVYVGLRDKRIVAIDRKTGQQRWEFRTGNPVAGGGVVSGGVLYQGSEDGKIYALDAVTGDELWSYDLQQSVIEPPAVTGTAVVVSGLGGQLYALDKATGQVLLEFFTLGAVAGAPAVSGDTAFIVTSGRRAVAVNLKERTYFYDGQLLRTKIYLWIWQIIDDAPIPKGEIWSVRLPSRDVTSPAISQSAMYFGSGEKLLALDRETGKTIWEFSAKAQITGSPVVTQDTVYTAAVDGRVLALEPATGELRWTFQTGGKIRTDPALAAGVLLVTSEDGALYALE